MLDERLSMALRLYDRCELGADIGTDHALLPILDLRGTEPKYIFVRSKIDNLIDFSFQDYMYYKAIPGTGTNGLIQNPNF